MKTLILSLSLLLPLAAQQTINGSRTILGTWDASGAARTAPVKVGALSAIPASCTAGDFYFATDGQVGRKLQSCTATNTWVPIGYQQGTSAPGTCTVGDLFFDTDATPGANLFGCTATNTWTALGGSGSTGVAVWSTVVPSSTIAAATNWGRPFGSAWGTTEYLWYAPVACTARDFYAVLNAAISGSDTAAFKIKVAGVESSVTCTINSSSTPTPYRSCSDTTHTVSVAKGDLVSIKLVNSVSVSGPVVTFSCN